jgi:hypothetical protein
LPSFSAESHRPERGCCGAWVLIRGEASGGRKDVAGKRAFSRPGFKGRMRCA